MSFSPALTAYRAATAALAPFAGLWLDARARSGKEDPARLGERHGRYAARRPMGRLVWLHAASVGESNVALGLIEALAARAPELSFLISTGTRTSSHLIARRAPARTTHVYAPLDAGRAVERFLDHWRPDAGVFVESEIWPNLILAAQARAIPLALVNARMSVETIRRWRGWPRAAGRLMTAFAYVSAADARTGAALGEIRGAEVETLGNLKLAMPAPNVDATARAALAAEIGARPVWLAASTHPGEDEIALAAHRMLRQAEPSALLIIAPRHPERGAAVAALAGGAPRRSAREPIGDAPVYVADTLGELGLLYDRAPVALVAGSLLPQLKGHNPVEPARLDAAILTGPHVESFQDLFEALLAARAALVAETAEALAEAVASLWRDDAARRAQTHAARAVLAEGAHALEATAERVLALTPARTQARTADAPA